MSDMQTYSDLEKQAAEKENPDGSLVWPTLSRETLNDSCSNCGTNRPFPRVPEVSLEKVMPFIYCIRQWGHGPKYVAYAGHSDTDGFVSDDPLEAALAALLSEGT